MQRDRRFLFRSIRWVSSSLLEWLGIFSTLTFAALAAVPHVLLCCWEYDFVFWNSFLECWSFCWVFEWVGCFFGFFFGCFVLRLEHFEERCSYSRQMPSPCLVLLGSGSAVPQVLGFLRYLELTLKPITLLGLLAYFHNFNWPYCVRLCLTAACSSILPFGVCVVGFVAAFELVQQFFADGPGGFHPAQTPLWQQYAWF